MSQMPGFKGKIRELATSYALDVSIVDGTGAQITTFGGGTQYTEADVDTTITGTAIMWEDTSDTLRAVSAAKPLPVAIISGAGSGGTAMTDDAAFTVATTSFTPAGGTYRSVRDSVDDNDGGAFAMTQKRALLAAIETPNGDSAMDDTNDAVRVNVVTGSTAGTQYTEGDVDTTITGNAIMWEDASDTLRAVSASKPLPVDTELPAAAALADDTSNPTVPGIASYLMVYDSTAGQWDRARGTPTTSDGQAGHSQSILDVQSHPMMYNGTTWDRFRGSSTDGLLVDLGTNNDVTITGTVTVSGTVTSNIGTTNGLALDATLTGGTMRTKLYDGTDTALITASGELNVIATAQPGVDIGDVTINNASGASAVNIQDGGNSITVDGTVSVTGSVDTELTTADLDTGVGTDTRAVVGLVLAASGGGVLVGSANPMPISDNGGSITVDATQSGTWTVQPGNTPNTTPWLASIHDGTTKATVRELGTNDALNVSICDGSGNQITTFGGGTQYTEGDTDTTITGTAMMWEDTSDTLRAVSASKPLPVTVVSGSSGQADKSSFTEGSSSFSPIGGVYNETISADPTEDQAAAARITAKRAIHTNLRNVSGTEIGTSSTPLRVDPTGTTTQPVSIIAPSTALTASSPTFATVGTSSASAVASNSSRKGLQLVNTSNTAISLGFGTTAVLNSGVTLQPGGSWEMSDRYFYTGAINAIAGLASSNLAIQEWT
jgi:hypothetical protein